MELRAVNPIRPESEIFISYGPYSNAKLLYSYGFVWAPRIQTHTSLARALEYADRDDCAIQVENPFRGVDVYLRPPTEQKNKLLHENPLTANQLYDFTGTVRLGACASVSVCVSMWMWM
jgi:hypothetical protein